MTAIKSLITGGLLLAAVCASATDYTISKNFITIPVKKAWSNGAKTVRLQVIGSKIIRVEATAAETFPEKNSLIILPQPAYTDFTVNETADVVIVRTSCITATVSETDGRVKFMDKEGKVLLNEVADGRGKVFKPYYVPDREI